MHISTPNEPEYLTSARAGNSEAFTALVEPHRKPLLVHCYRMSGSLIQLFHEKATFAMPPMGLWYAGRESIQRALQNFVFMPGVKWKLIPTFANGRPAFGIYQRAEDAVAYQAFGLILPVFAETAIVEVTAFLSPQLVGRFGLPKTVT